MQLGTPSELFNRLIETLRLLAASADDQIAAFPDTVSVPDEIVETFELSAAFLPKLVDAGIADQPLQDGIAQLDREFSEMSSATDKAIWTTQSLAQGGHWHQIRVCARAVLMSQKLEIRPPNLYWIEYT